MSENPEGSNGLKIGVFGTLQYVIRAEVYPVFEFMWLPEFSLEFFGVMISTLVYARTAVYVGTGVCLCELWTISPFHTQTDIKGSLN